MEQSQSNENIEPANPNLSILEQGNEKEILAFIEEQPEILKEVFPSLNMTPFEVLLNHGYENIAKKIINLPNFPLNDPEHNPLRASIKLGFTELANMLLDKNANPNSFFKDAPSILWLSLENNLFDLTDKILEKGGELNCRDDKGWTCLIRAAYLGRKNIVEYLLDKGANVNICTNDGWNAIVGAYVNNHTDIVSLLEEHDAIFNEVYAQAALITSYEKGNKTLTKAILDKGISPNFSDNKRDPLVIQAAAKEDIDFIEYLIGKGVDPNTKSNSGTPLLHLLAMNGHNSIIEKLIGYGADVNLKDKDKNTALMFACWNKQIKTVKVLINQKAGVNIEGQHGFTALHLAVRKEALDIIELLIRNNANSQLLDDDKNKPRDYITTNNHYSYLQKQMINRLNGKFTDD